MPNPRAQMLIEALASGPKDVARMLRPVAEADLWVAPAVDEWCVAQVVAHLVDIEPKFRARLQRIVEQDNPHEPFINPDEAAYDATVPISTWLVEFGKQRAVTTAYLSGLKNTDWIRICTHDTFGVTKLHQQVRILIGHDNEHLAQIVSIREKLAARAAGG
ncbi:MAG: DinB family protein [Anaerolineae bacterium]|nr:DinB family protein [Anaerolineae bacterium]